MYMLVCLSDHGEWTIHESSDSPDVVDATARDLSERYPGQKMIILKQIGFYCGETVVKWNPEISRETYNPSAEVK